MIVTMWHYGYARYHRGQKHKMLIIHTSRYQLGSWGLRFGSHKSLALKLAIRLNIVIKDLNAEASCLSLELKPIILSALSYGVCHNAINHAEQKGSVTLISIFRRRDLIFRGGSLREVASASIDRRQKQLSSQRARDGF